MWARAKKAIYWTVGIIILSIAGTIGKQIGSELSKPNKAEILNKVVTEAAKKLNAVAPKDLDDVTVMTSAEAIDGKVLAIYYTLKNFKSYEREFDFQSAKALVIKSTCRTQEGKKDSALTRGMSFLFVYSSDDGREVGRFEVTKKDCPYIL